MDYRLIFIGLTGALLHVRFAQTHQYYFVNTPLTWKDAQRFCRHYYTDLATIENMDDVTAVNQANLNYAGLAWIGLYDVWKWSLNDSSFYSQGESTFANWDSQQPNNLLGIEDCVELYSYSGKWNDNNCHNVQPFVCYNGTVNGEPSFVFINQDKSWNEAQRYCRENHVDVASARTQTENDIIQHLIPFGSMWIGLYRAKSWSDGSTSNFRHWGAGQPNGGYGAECLAAAFGDAGKWSDEPCFQSLPFICYIRSPRHAGGLIKLRVNETSITLQWNKVNDTSFVLQFNGRDTFISAPDGDGPVTHTVSSLTAGTRYTFTLFSVFGNVRDSGEQLTAVTAYSYSYSYSSSSAYPGPGHGGSRLSRDAQTSLSPDTTSSSSRGSPRRSQASRET
ncbi:hypothetical protein AMECASPLE_021162 [Ameca splendens]|uniref:C-type lectin domain-containing protein n=1 Tax=Ameca splendens TaxID=208324 RepID=A0ABV1A175_9TELE